MAFGLLVILMAAGSLTAWIWACSRLASEGLSLVRRALEVPPRRLVPWGAGPVGAVVLFYVLAQTAIALVFLKFRAAGLFPGGVVADKQPLRPSDLLVVMTCTNALALVAVPLLLFLMSGARPRDFLPESWSLAGRDVFMGLRAFLLATPVVYLAFWAASQIWKVENHPIFESLRDGLDGPLVFSAVMSGVVLAPAFEELAMRGVLLGWLVRVASQPRDSWISEEEFEPEVLSKPKPPRPNPVLAWIGNISVSLVFAALHSPQWPAPVPLFFLSLVLGWLYLRSGSVVAPWALHTAFNGLSTVGMLLQVQGGSFVEAPAAPRPAVVSPRVSDLTPGHDDLVSPQQAESRGDIRDRHGSGPGDSAPGRPLLRTGRTMDEKGATYLCDLIKSNTADSRGESSARYLIVLRGGVPGSMLPLSPGLRTLGRSSDSDLQLPEMSVSRRHATIETDHEGRVWLVDLGSSNGTFRNGERLQPGARHLLRDGDRIGFGPSLQVKFTCPDPTEERCQRELFERAFRDPLTGLFNRGYFLDQAAHLERQAASLGLGLAVLMLDIDHFKDVNDTYGHDAGDTVLKEVAQVIRSATRADDLVARYGGEEFVVALPIGSPNQATGRAERIRKTIAARRIALMGQSLRVTSSIGVAFSSPGRHRPLTALISAADAGLYQAKRAGRDQVVLRGENEGGREGSNTTIDFVATF